MKVLKGFMAEGNDPKERQKFIIVSLILIGLFVGLYLVQRTQELRRRAQVAGVDLTLVPSATQVLPQEQFSVDIVMNTNEFMVSATDIYVSFDSNYLEVQSIDAKDYLPMVLPPGPQIGNGRASIILGSLPTDPKKGTGILATINFKAKQAAVTSTEIMFATGTQIAAIGHTGDVTGNLTPTQLVVSGPAEPRLVVGYDSVWRVGDATQILLEFSTGKDENKISSITARITYPYSGTTPEIDVVETGSHNPASKITPSDSLISSGWEFPVNSVTRANGKVAIDIAAVNTSLEGFSSQEQLSLAEFFLKVNRMPANNPVELTFNMTETKMLTKKEPVTDILERAVGASYLISSSDVFYPYFRLQGVTGVCEADNIRLSFVNPSGERTWFFKATSTEGGSFAPPPVDITGLPIDEGGTIYEVFIKGPVHLRKRVGIMPIKKGANNSGRIETPLIAGDFDDDSLSEGFNKLDISDIGKILSVYTALEIPVNAANRNFDVDCNNVINIFDIALVLGNYTALQIRGD